MKIRYLAALLLVGSVMAADPTAGNLGLGSNEEEFLPVDEAFRFDASADGPDRIRLSWQITDGYYLYKSRISVALDDKAGATPPVQVGQPQLPKGDDKEDEFFGKQEVFHHFVEATVPIARAAGAALDLPIKVTYQGCADAGLCYPPETKRLTLNLPAASGAARLPNSADDGFVSEQDRYARFITEGSLISMLAAFFLGGLLLAMTPCVWPMVPILSGIIAGGGAATTGRRAFGLSLAYVLGSALAYAIAGSIAALAQFNLNATLQNPWIVGTFAAVFVSLALAMFGVYTLQLPAALQDRLAEASNRQRAGTLLGVGVMGMLSALIVSACAAPVLIGALIVISQTGDALRGGAALFAMGLGAGAPLLLIGTSLGRWMPRSGPWMDAVKHFFGLLFIAVAVWLLSRLVSGPQGLWLWVVPVVLLAVWFWRLPIRATAVRLAGRALAGVLAVYALLLAVGGWRGADDPLAPLTVHAREHALPFQRIKSVEDLERAVAAAAAQGQPVMLDFYADWCVSCLEMERYTFREPAVREALASTVLLQADVTANDELDQALLRKFGLFGPPTILFFGADGQERSNYRVVGYMKAPAFVAHVQAAGRS